ncbi:phage terminase, large subunit, PBSX family [Pseudarthrobacter equi]|uniref:Phage terminase, large subunit, PBSX family n=2 Tax=Pseudarthrobacter equi TaxID=728066 RepID=A0A1H2A854_9MICC|nr:phage terminase, large subunit, PBSX family [Pseudarthrobacter equi]
MAISPKQLDYLRNSNKSFNVCHGSVSSGKTVITLYRWVFFMADAPPGQAGMFGRTRESVKSNLWNVLKDREFFGDLVDEFQGNPLSGWVKMFDREVRVMGANDVNAEMTIRGATLVGACVDEITVLPEGFFKMLVSRLRVPRAQLFGTTNPDSPNHWFKVDFIDKINDPVKPLPGWTLWHFTMDDNPGLPASYVAQQKAIYAYGLFKLRFIDGLWVSGDGAIFDFWDPAKHVVKHADLPLMRRVYAVGLDGGLSSASAGIWLGLGADNVLYFFDEWNWTHSKDRAGLSYHEQAKLFVKKFNQPNTLGLRKADLKPRWTIVDSAALDFKRALRDNGITNIGNCKKDNVLQGIGVIGSMLESRKLKVSDSCIGLINEIPGYAWDQKQSLVGVDAPNKKNDHHLDAARYALMSTQGDWLRDMERNR